MTLRTSLGLIVAVAACGDDGQRAFPDAPVAEDAPIDSANECAPLSGAGTDHANTLSGDQTWTAADSPHRINSQVSVQSGTTLTLEPCAVVELGAGATLGVNGTLRAEGTPTRRIEIRAAEPGQPWRWIDGGSLILRNTTISGGGQVMGTPELSSMVRVRGPGGLVDVQSVELRGSASIGLQLVNGAQFAAGSADLEISQSALHPMTLSPSALTDLPAGDYTGNTTDVIDVAREAIGVSGQVVSVTMHPRNVPYRMGTSVDPNPAQLIGVGTGGTATLTIEAGSTLRFRPGYRMDVAPAAGGALVVVGTAAAPVTLTSAASLPAPGDWVGIKFSGIPTSNTRIDHTVIEYAGNPATSTTGFSCGTPPAGASSGQTMGAIVIASSTPGDAPTAFLTNSTIRDSASNGVDRGYRADTSVDFLATNTFARIQYCTQTLHRDMANGCPVTVPCPGS